MFSRHQGRSGMPLDMLFTNKNERKVGPQVSCEACYPRKHRRKAIIVVATGVVLACSERMARHRLMKPLVNHDAARDPGSHSSLTAKDPGTCIAAEVALVGLQHSRTSSPALCMKLWAVGRAQLVLSNGV